MCVCVCVEGLGTRQVIIDSELSPVGDEGIVIIVYSKTIHVL